MILTSPAARALFQAILVDPADDVPRLLLADVLEEAGEGERAEFIRVGCEVARREQDCRDCSARTKISQGVDPDVVRTWCKGCEALRRRERELLEEWRLAWEFPFWQILNPRCETFTGPAPWSFAFRRGFAAAVTLTLADWCGVVCPVCSGWRSREIYCEHCHGKGRTGGHGPGLVRAAPIEEDLFTDREPAEHPADGNEWWQWDFDDGYLNREARSRLPGILFDRMGGLNPDGSRKMGGIVYSYRPLALDARSRAALDWARQEAGLPALTG